MSEFPSLSKVLGKHTQICGGFLWSCECGVDWDENRDIAHAEHIADAWREACTIRTVEQLDALPDGSVIRESAGCGAVAVKAAGVWYWVATAGPYEPDLPAHLLDHPDWARP